MEQEYGYTEKHINERKKEIKAVKEAYGMDEYIDLGLEPAGLDKYETAALYL